MIREYSFRVKTLDNPLMRFTAEHRDHRILITLLRESVRQIEERAVFTFLGDATVTKRFLTGEFTKRYGTTDPIHEDDEHVSVEVSTHLLPELGGKTPNEITYEILGRDALFLPLLVHHGWLHVRVLSANEAAGRRFLQFLELMKEHLRPEDYQLFETREHRPDARMREAVERITPRQREVLIMAYDMGYWADPRQCNLEDIANRFNVSKAAVHKSLSAGERKIMSSFFEELLQRGRQPPEGQGPRTRRSAKGRAAENADASAAASAEVSSESN